jgi:hypothetical protein
VDPSLLVDPLRIAVEFDETAKAAMKERLPRIFHLSCRRDLRRVQFGIVFWLEPEKTHVGVVPAIARISRDAIHDHEVEVTIGLWQNRLWERIWKRPIE